MKAWSYGKTGQNLLAENNSHRFENSNLQLLDQMTEKHPVYPKVRLMLRVMVIAATVTEEFPVNIVSNHKQSSAW